MDLSLEKEKIEVRSTFKWLGAMTFLLAMLVSTVSIGTAAHNGNNRAEIVGPGDPDASGRAIVNYREGTGTFYGSITVRNLNPGDTYTFLVRGAMGEQVICSGEANDQGVFTCSEQNLTLNGFGTAVVRDSTGAEVASGVFERRGNCRDRDQAGSQCEADRLR